MPASSRLRHLPQTVPVLVILCIIDTYAVISRCVLRVGGDATTGGWISGPVSIYSGVRESATVGLPPAGGRIQKKLADGGGVVMLLARVGVVPPLSPSCARKVPETSVGCAGGRYQLPVGPTTISITKASRSTSSHPHTTHVHCYRLPTLYYCTFYHYFSLSLSLSIYIYIYTCRYIEFIHTRWI